MRKLVLVSLIAATLAAAPGPARACSCVGRSDQQAFAASSLVFTGRALSAEDPPPGGSVQSSAGMVVWTFDVEQVHKGVALERQRVQTGAVGGSCGFRFAAGERYQVFGAGGDPGSTNLCSGTRQLVAGVEPYTPSPPTALIVGAVAGALALAWSFRRIRDSRLPIDPGPRAPID